MSSIKTRKHYVIADAGFSAVWAAFYFLAFAYLSFCWSQVDSAGNLLKFDRSKANALGSILFSLLSAFAWVSLKSNPMIAIDHCSCCQGY